MLRSAALSLGLALGLAASSASAAVLGTFDIDYGPGGVVFPEAQEGTEFDSFDFSGLAGQQIDSLSVSVSFSGTGPTSVAFPGGGFVLPLERWWLDIAPGTGSVFADAANIMVSAASGLATLTRTIDASTDAANSETAFADAVSSLSLGFGFVDDGFFTNSFTLASASLSVEGTAVVPLPAPVWLLLTALGGLGLAARRQRNRFQTASNLS